MNDLQRILSLDMDQLSAAEIQWLHDLKNKAQAMTGRLQLKHRKEEMEMEEQGYGF